MSGRGVQNALAHLPYLLGTDPAPPRVRCVRSLFCAAVVEYNNDTTMLRHLIEVKPWRHSLGLRLSCRSFAGSGGGGGDGTSVKVFDRTAKRRHRDRAAAADWEGDFDYFREHIASALVDRIEASSPAALCCLLWAVHVTHLRCTWENDRDDSPVRFPCSSFKPAEK